MPVRLLLLFLACFGGNPSSFAKMVSFKTPVIHEVIDAQNTVSKTKSIASHSEEPADIFSCDPNYENEDDNSNPGNKIKNPSGLNTLKEYHLFCARYILDINKQRTFIKASSVATEFNLFLLNSSFLI